MFDPSKLFELIEAYRKHGCFVRIWCPSDVCDNRLFHVSLEWFEVTAWAEADDIPTAFQKAMDNYEETYVNFVIREANKLHDPMKYIDKMVDQYNLPHRGSGLKSKILAR